MTIFAFDGTRCTPIERSNVFKLYDEYEGTKKYYFNGPGSRGTWLSRTYETITGHGGKDRLNDAWSILKYLKMHKRQELVIIGFSRGGVLALEFAHMLDRFDIRVDKLGLFDPVGSFGIPFNDKDIGYRKTIPDNVMMCAHARANKITPVNKQAVVLTPNNLNRRGRTTGNHGKVGYFLRTIRGDHGTVGGTDGDLQAYKWMKDKLS